MAEELHFHLLELTRAECEVAWRDLVAKALANLSDPDGDSAGHAVDDVLEVHEHPLSGFWTHIGHVVFATHCAQRRLEHQVEITWFGQLTGIMLAGAFARFLRALTRFEVIRAEASFAGVAVHFLVAEKIEVPRHFPNLRVHDDRRFESAHLELARRTVLNREFVMVGDHVVPPRIADIPLQLHAERPVVPKAVEAAINLGRLKQESAAFAERNNLVHRLGHVAIFDFQLMCFEGITRDDAGLDVS